MKFRYFNSLVCFCLSSALVAQTAQALDADRLEGVSLSSAGQSHNENTQGLSHYITALYYEDIGDIDSAIRQYHKALALDSQSPLLHLNLASAYIKKNDIPSAITELKQSISLAPDAVEPHAILALIYTTQNKTDLAAQEYAFALKNVTKIEPENIDVYKSLGAIYLQQNKLREAEGIFKLVTGLSPRDAQPHFYLGSIYYELKDYAGVEKELKEAVRLKPDYHEALNFLGYFYLEQNRNINKAGVMIRKALSFEPENGAYIDSLGWFYFKKGKFKEALTYLEQAVSFLSDPVIYEHMGDVFMKLGNCDNARLNWEKSLKLDSTQERVKEKLRQVCQ
ncbi:MAG: tetratricopeptide repeat protein [Candidatus Omnitrophica bacterium]|nr:tetratricopeptide repeat protein [Candidatus Omnitrophota bacterium]